MKTYNIQKDIIRIRKFFSLSQEGFAFELGLSRPSIARYESGKLLPNSLSLENIYSYAYSHGLKLNKAKEEFYYEDRNGRQLLFHGAKDDIVGEVDTKHSIAPNDFGDAFYAGETLFQAATWVAENRKGNIYCFLFKKEGLKSLSFETDRRWMMAILYYRGAFKNFVITDEVKNIIEEIEKCDYLIAPIADNHVYEILNQFSNNEITDEACLHAVSATNLGKQYVFKSEKACKALECIDRLYLCREEKNDYINEKRKSVNEGIAKAELAKIEYRRKGKYFDELFKRI